MLQASKSSSLQLRAVEVMGASLLCDFSTGVPRPLIPVADRQKVFNAFHYLAHAGTRATRRLIAARAIWRGMNSDVAAWVRDCQACCRGKVTAQPAAPVQPIAVPAKRFSHVHLDLVGATTCGGGRLYLPADHGGPHYQVAGGRPAAHRGGGGVRGRLHCYLGHQVWSACHRDDRQG